MNTSNIGELVLSEQQIQTGVERVANELNQHFKRAVIITVVPGGAFCLPLIWFENLNLRSRWTRSLVLTHRAFEITNRL